MNENKVESLWKINVVLWENFSYGAKYYLMWEKNFFESFTQSQQGVTLVAWGEGLYSWQNIIDYRAPSACGE